VAFLQGYENTWNEGAGHTPAEQAGVDDVAFTSAAIAKLKTLVDVDDTKIAAVGFSNGGLLVEDLGCRLAAQVDLIVPVAAPLPVSVASSCAPTRPVSVLSVHGTADSSIPYAGGKFAGVGGGTTVLSAEASVARWGVLDKCDGSPSRSTPSTSVKTTTYRGCSGGATVSLTSLVGAGHAWPSDIGSMVAKALG
jgi:polyhydroxybutyrate depolymerase